MRSRPEVHLKLINFEVKEVKCSPIIHVGCTRYKRLAYLSTDKCKASLKVEEV